MSVYRVLLVVCCALLIAATSWAGSRPVTVSPGNPQGVSLIEARCPTFSWGAVAGARSYELVVYRIGEEGEEAKPFLREAFAGSVYGWTPSLDRCLERGGQYAWSVRAIGRKEGSDWSRPSLFQVASGRSKAEFEEALELVRSYLGVGGGTEQPKPAVTGGLKDLGVNEPSAVPASRSPTRGPAPEGTIGALSVEGEVRTVDPAGEPRLWGRGRKDVDVYGFGPFDNPCNDGGNLKLGLSTASVDWGSAADACPEGTWVCTSSEAAAGACNTGRPDDPTTDGLLCDGSSISWPSNVHNGWVEDQLTGPLPIYGGTVSETQLTGSAPSCSTFPVWCCWN